MSSPKMRSSIVVGVVSFAPSTRFARRQEVAIRPRIDADPDGASEVMRLVDVSAQLVIPSVSIRFLVAVRTWDFRLFWPPIRG